MSDKRDSRQLCECCKKSYVNIVAHRRSDYHKRHITQQAMPFAREQQQEKDAR